MNIRDYPISGAPVAMSRRGPDAGANDQAEDGLHLNIFTDFFSAAIPGGGLFSHVENMESLVSFPKGNAVFLHKGRADVETCQAGFGANLVGTVAMAGAGIVAGFGLAAAAMPIAGLGICALGVSGATNAFTRHQIRSVFR